MTEKTSRRKFMKYGAAVVGAAAVAAIGYGAYQASQPPPAPPPALTTVTQTIPTTTAAPAEALTVLWEESEFVPPVVDAYVKEFGVPVKLVPVSFDALNTKILADMLAPEPTYDVVQAIGSNISRFLEKGDYLLPLEDKLTPEIRQYVAWDMPELYYTDPREGKKHLYSVGWEQSPQLVFYNSEMFEEAKIDHFPVDYREVVDFATKLTKREQKRYGICLDFADDNMEMQWKQAYGAFSQYMYDKDTGEPIFNNASGREVTGYFRELWSRKAVNPESVNIDSSGTKVGIYITGGSAFIWTWLFGYFMSEDPDKSTILGKTKMALTPGGPLKKSSTITINNALGVAKHSKHIDRALHFINWVTTSEEAMKIVMRDKVGKELMFGAPSNKKLSDLYKDRPYMPWLKAQWDAFLAPPAFDTYQYRPWTGELVDIMNRVLKKGITGELTVEKALDQSVAELKEVMKKYGWPERTFNP